jgi:porphobilinogen synthase
MRRLRINPRIRELVRETRLGPKDLVQPIFVDEGIREASEVPSMPGIHRLPLSDVGKEAGHLADLGIPAAILFGIPARKDKVGSGAYDPKGIVQRAVAAVKETTDLAVITDVCLDEYTSHGHCGVLRDGQIDNDATLQLHARTAVTHARAGADMVAPSGMMDGQVAALRAALDAEGFLELPILAYAVKYASALYGPFREAAASTPSFGDRRSHQMDAPNAREALAEARLDVEEGADIIMVKPALPYLDILAALRAAMDVPLAAYQVSGEYSMLKAAAGKGWLGEDRVVEECLTAIKRAGASFIITYSARDFARRAMGIP